MNQKNNHGGARPGAGRKSRSEKGLEETKIANARVEVSVINACIEIHGSIANALRYAAKSKKKISKKY